MYAAHIESRKRPLLSFLLSPYAQYYKMLTDTGQSDLRPRRQLITDLIKDIKKKLNTGTHQIILSIDANEILEEDGTLI